MANSKEIHVDLVYAPSGVGKTTFCLDIARYIYRTTGKKTIWYLGDGGGETIYNTGWADLEKGFIRVVPFAARKYPLETCQLICEGYFLQDWNNPESALVKPSNEELSEIGLWVYEGLTFMSDYMMGDKEGGMAWRQAQGQGFNKDQGFQMKDGNLKFGAHGRSDYGFVQRRILDLVSRTTLLPGRVIFTAHERRVDDDDARETMFGPDVCGKALTPRIGGSFGNTLHLQRVHVTKKVTDPVTKKQIEKIVPERRLYTREHVDPEAKTFVKYIANCRLPRLVAEKDPDFMPEYLSPPDPVEFYRRLLVDAPRLNAKLEAEQTATDLSQELVPLI